MNIPIYQVDAFTSKVFSGNPAAVCILERWIDDSLLQAIAAENNLSETAFLVEGGDGFDLRWFTSVTEVALCGHATLASAFVLFVCRDWEAEIIRFQTRKSGQLTVTNQRREEWLRRRCGAASGFYPPLEADRYCLSGRASLSAA
jgi:PhzF family phenazine biosynthesis protein